MSGPELKQRLELAGIEQVEVARRAGLCPATVCLALSDKRRLTPRVREAAEALIRERAVAAVRALAGANGA